MAGGELSLQQALSECQDQYQADEAFTTFPFTDAWDCVVVSHTQQHGAERIHLAVYEQDAGAAVVATIANATIEEEEPPEDREFIIAQVFLICSGTTLYFLHTTDR